MARAVRERRSSSASLHVAVDNEAATALYRCVCAPGTRAQAAQGCVRVPAIRPPCQMQASVAFMPTVTHYHCGPATSQEQCSGYLHPVDTRPCTAPCAVVRRDAGHRPHVRGMDCRLPHLPAAPRDSLRPRLRRPCRSLGFEEDGLLEGYYGPGRSAIKMRCDLQPP